MNKFIFLFLVFFCVTESSAQCNRRLEVNYPLFVYFNTHDVLQQSVDSGFQTQLLELVIDTSEIVCVEKQYEGYLLRVSNYDSTAVLLSSVDGAILVYVEALIDTNWRPITSIAASDCGNSYYCTNLKSGHMLEFPTPAFTGTYATRLRYVLIHAGTKLYSNEINAHIHPEQWNKLNFLESEREWILDVNQYIK